MPTPLSVALQAGLVVVLRELAEAEIEALAWGWSSEAAAVLARRRWHYARRNVALMVTAWRAAGVDLGDGA